MQLFKKGEMYGFSDKEKWRKRLAFLFFDSVGLVKWDYSGSQTRTYMADPFMEHHRYEHVPWLVCLGSPFAAFLSAEWKGVRRKKGGEVSNFWMLLYSLTNTTHQGKNSFVFSLMCWYYHYHSARMPIYKSPSWEACLKLRSSDYDLNAVITSDSG